MKAVLETIDQHQRQLEIEVDETRVAEGLERAFKKVVKNVAIPGFRKGKIPRAVFEKRFGVESLYQEALDIILPEIYFEAVKETGIEPVDFPKLDVVQFGKGEKLKFKAVVVVKPEVTLGEYKGIQVPDKDFSATDEDVDAELKKAIERRAELIVLEADQASTSGDELTIDYEGFVDGEAFDGGKGQNYQLTLGSNTFIPGFEDQLIGSKKGDEKTVEVTFPESYHHKPLAGKLAKFEVTVHDIKRKVYPELDDELAKDMGEFESLEEWKTELKEQIAHRKLHDQNHYIEGAVIDAAVANAKVDVPEVMIKNEIETMIKDMEQRIKQQGINLDLYLQLTGMTKESLEEQSKPEAEKRVIRALVLEAIAKAEAITISEDELQEEFERVGNAYQLTAKQVEDLFDKNQTKQRFIDGLVTQKTVEYLVNESSAAHLIHIHE